MAKKKVKPFHITVPILDIDSILPFNREEKDFTDFLIEKEKIKEEIMQFVEELKKIMKEDILYIGGEESQNKFIEKFILQEGGFLEFVIEKPLAVNAHFTKMEHARRYLKAIKKVLNYIIPDSAYKPVFIDSLTINTKKEEHLTFEKWNKMHRFYIKDSVIFTMLAFVIVVIFEGLKKVFEMISIERFHFESAWVSVFGAIFIAFMFEPIKKRAEKLIDKYLTK